MAKTGPRGRGMRTMEFHELAGHLRKESFAKDVVLKRMGARGIRVVVQGDAISFAQGEGRLAAAHYGMADRERWLVTTTLIAAGVQAAEATGQGSVDIAMIHDAWNRTLALCPPGMPPHLCAKLSIVDRELVLLKRGDTLAELLGTVFK